MKKLLLALFFTCQMPAMAPPHGGGQLNGFAFYTLAAGITAWFKKLREPEQIAPNPPDQSQQPQKTTPKKQLVNHSGSQSSVRVYHGKKSVVVVASPGYSVHVITAEEKSASPRFDPYNENEKGE